MSTTPFAPESGPPDVELLFGPMLIGVFLNTTLYGVLLVQMLVYYQRYKRDRTWFRYLALYLLIAETVNVVFDIGLIYEPLIFRYGTAKALEISPLLLRPDAAVTIAISTPVQLFVAWRVKVLSESYFFPFLIALSSLISLGGGLSVTIMVSLHSAYADFASFHPFVITWLSSTAACDVVLSGALIYSLISSKLYQTVYNANNSMFSILAKQVPARPTDTLTGSLVVRLFNIQPGPTLMAWAVTVQTGSITAITALLDLFVFLFSPSTTLQFIWDFPLSKLYTNALLSTLNARPWWDEGSSEHTTNVLFEQTPTSETARLSSFSAYAAQGQLELTRRRRELSSVYTNRDHESTEDPERGDDLQKVSPL
ncbi:hypothetical protein C8R44DRAFT_885221 [Mycena epipterygia]|nr:hypothetical protein C8R44DRAFT_885221 [Mycena epipterygia]